MKFEIVNPSPSVVEKQERTVRIVLIQDAAGHPALAAIDPFTNQPRPLVSIMSTGALLPWDDQALYAMGFPRSQKTFRLKVIGESPNE